MIKLAISGLVGFTIGAAVTHVPVLTRAHDETAARATQSGPAAIDPFALTTQGAKDLPTTDVLNYF